MLRATTIEELRARLVEARGVRGRSSCTSRPTRWSTHPSSESWWDVPVSEVAALDSTQQARKTYDQHKQDQRAFLAPSDYGNDPTTTRSM